MRASVDQWDPSYGTSFDGEPADTTVDVDLGFELALGDWHPITPSPSGDRPTVVFVDGVRRVEARLWIGSDRGEPADPAIAASWAAGAVVCRPGRAERGPQIVSRGLFTASTHATDLDTAHGLFARHRTASGNPEALTNSMQQAMARDEVEVSAVARAQFPGSLLVVDGPLRDRDNLADAVGLIKTHHRSYLDGVAGAVLAALGPGQRTPLVTIGTTWARHSWYLRLDAGRTGPLAGVVRFETSAALSGLEATALADRVSSIIPTFRSEAHKDSRAPQNLYPIGGLERDLRHRLGDPKLIYRGLRAACLPTAR